MKSYFMLVTIYLIIVCSTFMSNAQERVPQKSAAINLNPNQTSKVRIFNGVVIKPSVNIIKYDRIIQVKDTLIIENELSPLYDKINKIIIIKDPFYRNNHRVSRKLPIIINKKLIDYRTELSIEPEKLNIISVKFINGLEALKNGYKNMPFGYLELKNK